VYWSHLPFAWRPFSLVSSARVFSRHSNFKFPIWILFRDQPSSAPPIQFPQFSLKSFKALQGIQFKVLQQILLQPSTNQFFYASCYSTAAGHSLIPRIRTWCLGVLPPQASSRGRAQPVFLSQIGHPCVRQVTFEPDSCFRSIFFKGCINALWL
jgi:hypothetical protein